MTGNPIFWLTLSLYFFAAASGSFVRFCLRRKASPLLFVYPVLWVLSTIGLWLNYSPLGFKDVVSPVSLMFAAAGLVSGYWVFLHPLALIAPLVISLYTHTPAAPFLSYNIYSVGSLLFYPSNEGTLTLGWTPYGEKEMMISLDGPSAGVLFVRKDLPRQYFFLKEQIYPVAIISRSVPVSALADAEPDWYFPLRDAEKTDSRLYSVSYPAVRFYTPGFFTSREYRVEEGTLLLKQR